MKIAIIGAAGNLGSRIAAEGLRRGHQITPLTRANLDATDTHAVTGAIQGHDVTVGATRPAPGREDQAAVIARALLEAHAAADVRFIMVGGAGSLHAPDTGQALADDRRWVPARIADLARSAIAQLQECHRSTDADWTYVSPSALMEPGLRTGHYRTGDEELLVNDDGTSYVSMEDMAVAILDEIEKPSHRRQRFTVATTPEHAPQPGKG